MRELCVVILLVALCYWNQGKLRQDEPVDLIYLPTCPMAVLSFVFPIIATIQNENHQKIEITVPSSVPVRLLVPEEMDGREGTVRDFAARCSGIIKEALKWAPETTRSLLQVSHHHHCSYSSLWIIAPVSLSLSLSGLIYRPQLWLLHCRFSGGFDELTIDQDRISLYTIKTMSSRQVMREKRKR